MLKGSGQENMPISSDRLNINIVYVWVESDDYDISNSTTRLRSCSVRF